MKTYHIYHSESQQAELKFEKAEKEKNRIEQDSKKGVQSKRFKAFEKQFEKVLSMTLYECFLNVYLNNVIVLHSIWHCTLVNKLVA